MYDTSKKISITNRIGNWCNYIGMIADLTSVINGTATFFVKILKLKGRHSNTVH
jgi:hypothetical protein